MRVRCVEVPLAAWSLALLLGCQRPPDVRGTADGAARDARADGGSDRVAAPVDAAGRDSARLDAARPAANRPEPPRPDANRPDGGAIDAKADVSVIDAARGDGGDAAGSPMFELLGAPLVFAPTPRGFGLSVVLRSGDPRALQ